MQPTSESQAAEFLHWPSGCPHVVPAVENSTQKTFGSRSYTDYLEGFLQTPLETHDQSHRHLDSPSLVGRPATHSSWK